MRSFDEWFDENCDGSDLAKDACRKLWDEFSDQINIICRKSYEKQQSKVDELKLQVAEMKSRMNDAYTAGQSAMYAARQSKVDELQALFDQHDQWLGQRNRDVQELYDINIKHAAEKAELQKQVTNLDNRATKYALDAMATAKLNAELRKRVDDAQKLIDDWNCGGVNLFDLLDELEQALKGGNK